jgi:hypothetical protein
VAKMTQKVVNMGYGKMLTRYAHCPPWGFFCEDHQVSELFKVLEEVQQCAFFVNKWAIEMKSPRRVRIDAYPIKWDPEDEQVRRRVGEGIAEKLIELRQAYTAKIMWHYRTRFEKARNSEKILLPGPQIDVIREALAASKEQRKYMIAIHGARYSEKYIDPFTHLVKKDVKLDYGPIDKAIRYFAPGWQPT